MVIKDIGSYVKIKYTVSLDSGEIVKGDPSDGLEHLCFVTGFDQVLPGLERRLIGLKSGDAVKISIPPEEAFGLYDGSLVVEKSFIEFPHGKSLEPGRWVLAANKQHKIQSSYYVRGKRTHSVIIDYNHPFAGKTLTYDLLVAEARPATQEELALIRPCDFEPGARTQIVETCLGGEEGQRRTQT